MGFFDTLTETITGRNANGRTPEEEAHFHRAKWLEYDFYNFAQVWIIPGEHVHSSEIVERFQVGVHKKYGGEEYASDIETLQLLARWNERYGNGKWSPKGTYIGFQLNPAAVKAAEDYGKELEEAKAAARDAKRNKSSKKKKKKSEMEPKPLTATFRNTGTNIQLQQAQLYYETTLWGNIGHGDPPISVGSFTGHRWFVKVGDTVMKEMEIGTDDVQEFTF
ncbi:P4Hc [Seminavis robusta]|uniref:P4Hc n=1 Tax=Seminavis robusta TaxID=568900 RepID=A0A9N8EWU4_9STRA|nr:P4Hc [Seminavis robusta]|eukprot:Sro1934_g306330.1 P4Hc (221) ;mRNA; r:14440-15102